MNGLAETALSNRGMAFYFSDFLQLTKARLSLSVVFSSLAGYLLGAEEIKWTLFLMLALGGYFMVGASNIFNQIIERDLDALMQRTRLRPLPAGRITVTKAMVIAVLFSIVGIGILYFINPLTALFGAVSIFLYTSIYTPLKTLTPLSVLAGAFPGAIPFMLGWVAATHDFDIEPGTLFMIQFFWQFPHFWAIAWVLDDDYKRAGFKMLPTGHRDTRTATQIILYTIWTIAASLLPAFGFTGSLRLSVLGAVAVGMLGIGMLFFAIKLYRYQNRKSALHLMSASVVYITLLQLIFVLDKFLA